MKIELPGGNRENNNTSKRKAVEPKSQKTEKTDSGRIRWRKRGNYMCDNQRTIRIYLFR